MGGELSLNPIRISHWPVTISFLIKNNFLNSALASFFVQNIGYNCFVFSLLIILCIRGLTLGTLNIILATGNLKVLFPTPHPHLAGCLYLSNEFKGQSLMQEKQGPGWLSYTQPLVTCAKGKARGRFKTARRPRFFIHSFSFLSTKHPLSARHIIGAIWHGHATIRKTPPEKRKGENTKVPFIAEEDN